jgi:hypothetical protein
MNKPSYSLQIITRNSIPSDEIKAATEMRTIDRLLGLVLVTRPDSRSASVRLG